MALDCLPLATAIGLWSLEIVRTRWGSCSFAWWGADRTRAYAAEPIELGARRRRFIVARNRVGDVEPRCLEGNETGLRPDAHPDPYRAPQWKTRWSRETHGPAWRSWTRRRSKIPVRNPVRTRTR